MSPISSLIKGLFGELQGSPWAKVSFHSQIYRSIKDVTIPISKGMARMDPVIVSKHGVFAAETRNINGWGHDGEVAPKAWRRF